MFDARNAAQVAQLKSEIQTDPNAYGYSQYVSIGDDTDVANLLNLVRDGTNGAAITVRRSDISPNELLEAIDTRDFAASPSTGLLSWFQSVANLKTLRLINDDGSNTRIITNLQLLITSNVQGSRTRLSAVSVRNGSRAEQLFGTNTFITADNVALALRG